MENIHEKAEAVIDVVVTSLPPGFPEDLVDAILSGYRRRLVRLENL